MKIVIYQYAIPLSDTLDLKGAKKIDFKMTNTFIPILLLLAVQVSSGQDGMPFNPDQTPGKEGWPGQLIIPFRHRDPTEQIKAIQHFNNEGKRLRYRGDDTYQLDSTIQIIPNISGGFEKRVRYYQYGFNGKTKTSMIALVTPDGDTTGIHREEFLYNELNLVSQFDWWLDYPASGASVNFTRLYLHYNSSQLLETYLNYYYTGSTELEPGDSIIYTYNSQGLPVLILHHNWDDSTSTWVESYKEEFIYNPFKELLSYITSGKNESSSPWVYYSKQDYTHAQGLLRSIITSTRVNNAWEKSTRSDFAYDNRDNLLQQSDKVWIPEGFQWQDDRLFIYEYDGEDNRITARDRRWFQDGHEWLIGDSLSFEYNQMGDTTMIWLFSGGSTSNPWTLSGGGRYHYNSGIPFADIRWPQSYLENLSVTFNYMVTGSLLSGHGDSHSSDSLEYYYSVIFDAAKEIHSGPVSFYPNPAVNWIQFNIPGLHADATLKLFTLMGSLSLSTLLDNSHTVDVSDLIPGVYLFEIRNGWEVYTGKVVIQH